MAVQECPPAPHIFLAGTFLPSFLPSLLRISSLNHYRAGCIRGIPAHWAQCNDKQPKTGRIQGHFMPMLLSPSSPDRSMFLFFFHPSLFWELARGCGIAAGGLQGCWGDAGLPCSSAVCQRRQGFVPGSGSHQVSMQALFSQAWHACINGDNWWERNTDDKHPRQEKCKSG